MIIKNREYETCGHCDSRKMISDEQYGCDSCQRPMVMDGDYLSATIHNHNNESRDLHFCSWDCAFKTLAKASSDYFITLPFLLFDAETKRGQRAKDFFKAIRAFK